MPLRGLSEAAVGELVAHHAGVDAKPDLVRTVHDVSAGNPFFADELLRLILADGEPIAAGGTLPLPEGVAETIRRRIAPLRPETTRILTVGAVIGGEFRLGTLAAAADVELGAALAAVDEATRAGLVTGEPGSRRFHFAHALVRETLLAALTPGERSALHADVARALRERYGESADEHLPELAFHVLEAVPHVPAQEALRYALDAGHHAVARFDHAEGARLFDRAADLRDVLGPDDARDADVFQALGEARMRAGDIPRRPRGPRARRRGRPPARRSDARGAGGARLRPLGPVAGRGRGRRRRAPGRGRRRARRRPAATSASTRCARGCGRGWPAPCTGRPRAGGATGSSPTRRRSSAVCARGWGPRTSARPTRRSRSCSGRRSWRPGAPTPPSRASSWPRSSWRSARARATRSASSTRARGSSACSASSTTCPAPRRHSDAYAELAERLRQPRMQMYVPLHEGMTAILEGRWADAERSAMRAGELGGRTSNAMAPLLTTAQLGVTRVEQDRGAEIEEAVRAFATRHAAMPAWRAALVLVLAQAGREAEASDELERLAARDFPTSRATRCGCWPCGCWRARRPSCRRAACPPSCTSSSSPTPTATRCPPRRPCSGP